MYDSQRRVSDEDIGIRAFKVRQAKAVERAVERLRHGLGPVWKDLTEEEIEEVEWILGELWKYVSRSQWDAMRFGHLGMGEVARMLALGSQLRRHARPSTEILDEIRALVESSEPTG